MAGNIYGVSKNKGLQPIINEFLMAFLEDDTKNRTIVNTDAEQKIMLKSGLQEGDNLAISNGSIVIGSGVERIRISAEIMIDLKTEGRCVLYVYKNDVIYARHAFNNAFYIQSLGIPGRPINVAEGDIISLKVKAPKDSIISETTASSYLTVEVMNKSN